MKPFTNKNIAILTTESSWIVPYCKDFKNELSEQYSVELFFNHKEIDTSYEVVFILGYTKIITKEYLNKHQHNLVVHESDLPEGKGWAPLFWQILEHKNQIPIVLFEATEKVDDGIIYLKDYIELDGSELNHEIRLKQAKATFKLCLSFLESYEELKPYKPIGKESYYSKRGPENSKLDIHKTIEEQFNLLRIVENNEYPAFFEIMGKKYKIKIEPYETPE
ncbi:MAG: hypothetical protein JXR60_09580 [Bacteroidales bacterium]|nr:hypothetical protein [Bacteroidales bacterium]